MPQYAIKSDVAAVNTALRQLAARLPVIATDQASATLSDALGVYATESGIQSGIDGAVSSLGDPITLEGTWDASSGSFPGSGTAQTGHSYIVSVGGTVDSVAFSANDRILAITDNASTSTYASNWLKLDYSDIVTSVAGRTGDVTLDSSDITDFSSAVATEIGAADVIGLVERSSDPSDPAEGNAVIWLSNATDSGDDGDLMVKITAGGVTKTATLIDFSTV